MVIMRAFVAVRQMVALPKTDKLTELQNEVKELKDYIDCLLYTSHYRNVYNIV